MRKLIVWDIYHDIPTLGGKTKMVSLAQAETVTGELRTELEALRAENERLEVELGRSGAELAFWKGTNNTKLVAEVERLRGALEDIASIDARRCGGELYDPKRHDRAKWFELQNVFMAAHAKTALSDDDGEGI